MKAKTTYRIENAASETIGEYRGLKSALNAADRIFARTGEFLVVCVAVAVEDTNKWGDTVTDPYHW